MQVKLLALVLSALSTTVHEVPCTDPQILQVLHPQKPETKTY